MQYIYIHIYLHKICIAGPNRLACFASGDIYVYICIYIHTILIDGKGYHQKSGLAMGNTLAPTLAIIYMNELDEQIIHKSGGAVSLKRFIDDIFAVLTSDKINEDKLLEISNSLSDAIKFTIELPEDNGLPFLDPLVSFDHSNKFSTELYVKPIHSQSITPWDSHGSVSSKRDIVAGEIKRAMACSTDKKSERRSIAT